MIATVRRLTAAFLGAGAFAALIATAYASPQQTTLQGFVGTWQCVTRTADNKTYNETDTDTMFGNWLKIDAAYLAQGGAPATSGATFVGYDAKHRRWVITGVATDDTYFTASSSSPAWDGSKWTNAFPNDHGTAVVHAPANGKYTVESSTPNMQGKMVMSHTICTKQ